MITHLGSVGGGASALIGAGGLDLHRNSEIPHGPRRYDAMNKTVTDLNNARDILH